MVSSVTITSPALSVGTVTLEISAEAEALVKLTENSKSFNSVAIFKLLAALNITRLRQIPQTPDLPGNVEDAVQDILAGLKDAVALAEASSDF